MKKALFIMGIPKGCQECRFCGCDGDECLLIYKEIPEKTYLVNERLVDCPLRKLPDRLKTVQGNDYPDGWNDCLDKIEE